MPAGSERTERPLGPPLELTNEMGLVRVAAFTRQIRQTLPSWPNPELGDRPLEACVQDELLGGESHLIHHQALDHPGAHSEFPGQVSHADAPTHRVHHFQNPLAAVILTEGHGSHRFEERAEDAQTSVWGGAPAEALAQFIEVEAPNPVQHDARFVHKIPGMDIRDARHLAWAEPEPVDLIVTHMGGDPVGDGPTGDHEASRFSEDHTDAEVAIRKDLESPVFVAIPSGQQPGLFHQPLEFRRQSSSQGLRGSGVE